MTPNLDQPLAGLLAPLFALRSDHDLGIGDTRALRQFVDWAAAAGFRLVQLLPVNETGGDHSPYNAISSTALDPTTIDTSPSALPDLAEKDFAAITRRAKLERLVAGPVLYPEVKRLKRRLLEAAFATFERRARRSARVKAFDRFSADHAPWLDAHALFRTLMDAFGDERWDRWPAEVQTAAAARQWLASRRPTRRATLDRAQRFHRYVQWLAFSQWTALKRHCDRRGVALMGDVPFGISYYSADVFAEPDLFDLEWSGGAPPERFFRSDPFTEKWGQNWGIPLYRWDAHRRTEFAWWRRRVRTVRSIFHLFRIDHILGFYRIYSFPWRPERNGEFLPLDERQARERTGGRLPGFAPRDDATPENRAANRAQGDGILRVLLAEVGRHRLIGEDLGVVPDYVRPNLAELEIAGFKIPLWEKTPDGRLIPGSAYPRLSFATYATHDHPPLRALWEDWRRQIEQGREARDRALHEMRLLAAFAGIPEPLPRPYDDGIREALLAALFRSNAWLATLMITDLFGSAQRFNVPGAVAASNWSERLDRAPGDWRRDPPLRKQMTRVRDLLRNAGR